MSYISQKAHKLHFRADKKLFYRRFLDLNKSYPQMITKTKNQRPKIKIQSTKFKINHKLSRFAISDVARQKSKL